MIRINEKHFLFNQLFEISCYTFVIGLFFSRAVLSFSIASIFIFGLFSFILRQEYNIRWDLKFLFFPVVYIVYFISILNTSNTADWLSLIVKNAPLFCIPLGFQFAPYLNSKKRDKILFLFFLLAFVCVISTAFKALIDFETFSQLVLQSKNIEPVNGLNHIELGVLSVTAFIILGDFTLKEKRIWAKKILIGISFLYLLSLHIIAYRFALFTIYLLFIIYSIYTIVKKREYIKGLIILTVFLLIIIVLYNSLDAFKNRIINTRVDIESIIRQENPNFQSVHQRWAAIKCAVEITKKNVLYGVSPADLSSEMQHQYNINSYLLIPENRIFIHNQFLFYAASFGIPFVFLFGCGLLFVLYQESRYSYLPIMMMIPFLLHMQIDNTLEKQITASGMLFFFFLTGHKSNKKQL